MIRHKRTIEQKFKAIVAMIVAMGLVSGFTLQDGTISDAWSLPSRYLVCTDPSHVNPEDHTESCYCIHTSLNYTPNADGTSHTVSCNDCSVDYWTEECNMEPVFDIYTHKHTTRCKCGRSTEPVDCVYTTHYEDNHDGTHDKICDDCGGHSTAESCTYVYDSTSPNEGKHFEKCSGCGNKIEVGCNYGPWTSCGSGTNMHGRICSYCNEPEYDNCFPEKYTVDAGTGKYKGTCSVCGNEDVLSSDEADAVEKFYAYIDAVKRIMGIDCFDGSALDSDGNLLSTVETQISGLGDSQKAELWSRYNEDFAPAMVALSPGGIDPSNKILRYTEAMCPAASAIASKIGKPGGFGGFGGAGPSPLSLVEEVKIQSYDGDGTTPISGAEYYIYKDGSAKNENCVYVVGTTKIEVDNIAKDVSKAGNIITVPQGVDIVVLEKKKPNDASPKSYSPIASEMKFKYTPGGSSLSKELGAALSVDNGASPKQLKITYDELKPIGLKLFDTSSELPASITNAKYEIYKYGEPAKKVVWTRNLPMAICTDGDIRIENGTVLVPTTVKHSIKETEAPAGYIKRAPSIYDFTPVGGTPTMGINSVSDEFENITPVTPAGTQAKIIYQKIETKEVKFKFIKLADSTDDTSRADAVALSDGSVTINAGSDSSSKPLVTAGSVITAKITNDPNAPGVTTDASGTLVFKDGETLTVKKAVAPFGYKDFAESSDTKFTANYTAGTIAVGAGAGTSMVNNAATPANSIIYLVFEPAPTLDIEVALSGDGKSSSTKPIVIDKLTGKSLPVTSGKVSAYYGREYVVSATDVKKGYLATTGTFTTDGTNGKVTAVSGKVTKDSDTKVTLALDKAMPDIKVYKYPKKDGKDAPDTKKDALKGWKYTVDMYEGAKTTADEVVKDTTSSHWDEEVDTISVTSSASKDYDTLDTSKLTVESYYRIKTGTDTYAYFYINSDGTVKAIKGNIDTNDDGDEIYLWDDDPDEDSDDVIAIHKVNNTGTDLSGAHLQIYLYSDSNTLVYGSSSSSSTSSSTSSTSSSTNSSTNSSTSSSTTKAKTTPAKPSVATNDVKFDWTSSDKAKVIDIDDLEKGKNYTLREVSAPSGYETPAYDFVFKYGTDGKLSIVRNYNGLLSVTGNKLVLKNLTPTEAAATRPKTGDHSKLALWLDICIVMLGGLYLSGYSIFESFTEKKKVKVVAKKKPNNRRKR